VEEVSLTKVYNSLAIIKEVIKLLAQYIARGKKREILRGYNL